MSSKFDARMRKALSRCKVAWFVLMLVSTWFAFANFSPWFWLLLIPFAYASYVLLLFITVNILANTITEAELTEAETDRAKSEAANTRIQALKEISARYDSGEISDADAVLALAELGVVDVIEINDTGPVIGNYHGHEIYEYITVKAPGREVAEKMAYHGPANIINGILQIPEIPGMIFASVENILYSKEIPAQQK